MKVMFNVLKPVRQQVGYSSSVYPNLIFHAKMAAVEKMVYKWFMQPCVQGPVNG